MKNFVQIIVAIASSLCCNSLLAQITPSIEWQKCFGGSFSDLASAVLQTSDSGYIVAGSSSSNDGDVSVNHGGDDCWIVKLNSVGNLIWQTTLGGSDLDEAYSIQETFDRGFIIAGRSTSIDGNVSGNHGLMDCLIIKLDSSGDLIWQKCLGGSSYDGANSIKQTSDSGFIVAGYSLSDDGNVSGNHGGTYFGDYWIVKLDNAGNITWQNSLGGSQDEQAYCVQQTTDGGYIVLGESFSNDGDVSGNHGGRDYWLVKLDTDGNLVWQKSLGGSDFDEVVGTSSVQQTLDGGFIIIGASASIDGEVSGNHGAWDYWVVKLGSGGNIVWKKCFGGGGGDTGASVKQTYDGGFIVAGWNDSNDGDITENYGFNDYWILKLDSIGNIIWQKSLGGTGDDRAFAIQQTNDSGFIMAGYSNSNDNDVSGNHGDYDFWIVKLSGDIATQIPNMRQLQTFSVFPNPASGIFFINYSLSTPAIVNIDVYDVLGNKLNQLVINDREQGQHTSVIDTRKFANGIYFLQILAGDQIMTQKMDVEN